MKERALIILDEPEYAGALADRLNRSKELDLLVLNFASESDALKHIKEYKDVYLLVNENKKTEEISPSFEEGHIIVLAENRGGEKNGPWIYKYQSATLITKEIISLISDRDFERIEAENKIYTVFSPKNALEREEYAKVLCRDLNEKGSVLYLDMETFSSEGQTDGETERGMSELIYYIKKGGEQLKWKLKSVIKSDGMSGRILPVRCSLDLFELNGEDMKRLIGILEEMTEYTFIIINLGFYNNAASTLFSLSSHIDVVVTRGKGSKESADYFMEELRLMKRKEIERRVQIVEFEANTFM